MGSPLISEMRQPLPALGPSFLGSHLGLWGWGPGKEAGDNPPRRGDSPEVGAATRHLRVGEEQVSWVKSSLRGELSVSLS